MKNRCLNRELTIEMIVGTFMASVFIVLLLFTIVISGGHLLQKSTRMEVLFEEVMGLRSRDSVLVRGVPAGQVEALNLEDGYVRVVLRLDQPVELRRDYRIRVVGASLLGGNNLIIEEGEGEPLPAGAVIRGEKPRDLMLDLGDLAGEIRESLVEGGALDNLRETSADLAEVAARVREGRGTLGRLLSEDDTLYNDLAEAMADIRELTDRISAGNGLLGRLFAEDDGGMYDDLRSAVASLREVTDRIAAGRGAAGKFFGEDSALYDDLSETVARLKRITAGVEQGEGTLGLLLNDEALYREWANTGADLRTMMARIEAGEGTLGKLLSSDDSLYREIEAVFNNAREALDDLRESSPVTTFSTLLFGAF